jgi:hypothetical protein
MSSRNEISLFGLGALSTEESVICAKYPPKMGHFYVFRKFCSLNFLLKAVRFHLYMPLLRFLCLASKTGG